MTPFIYTNGTIVYSYKFKSLGRIAEITELPYGGMYSHNAPFWVWIDVYIFDLAHYCIHEVEEIIAYDELTSLQKIALNII